MHHLLLVLPLLGLVLFIFLLWQIALPLYAVILGISLGIYWSHNDRHIGQTGRVLTSSCPVCHTMPQRSPLLPLGATTPVSTQPWHPWPLKGKHSRILYRECHKFTANQESYLNNEYEVKG
jgi:hypothetical protein